jgi:iron complex transport system substrate-binding protein
MWHRSAIALALCMRVALSAAAAITVQDDAQHVLTLQTPAQRIVSLAPHTTELLFAVGAGARIVGVGEFSDYPPQARSIPLIGSSSALDLERILALKPDLVVAWGSGNLAPQVAKLRGLGIPVFDSEPRDFETVATNLERLGELAGAATTGKQVAAQFRSRLKQLTANYAGRAPVTVFYQVWRAPLMTLNDAHMVSTAIRLCGGQNIFGKLAPLVPTVSEEAVLQADPEVIFAGSSADDPQANWQRYGRLTAVRRGNIYKLNSDWMTRAGPRVLDGVEALCRHLDTARTKRPKF